MEKYELIKAAKRIGETNTQPESMLAEASEFLRVYAGENSSFYKQVKEVQQQWNDVAILRYVKAALNAFISFLKMV